jgi:Cu(I)/Ag(I) efflux system periplasmic protein CusF
VDHAAHHGASAAAPQSDGEVRKVDKAQGKLTLRHGPLENLSMPGMTMVFKVADPKMLDSVKEGDKVKFTAEKVNGAFTVTARSLPSDLASSGELQRAEGCPSVDLI